MLINISFKTCRKVKSHRYLHVKTPHLIIEKKKTLLCVSILTDLSLERELHHFDSTLTSKDRPSKVSHFQEQIRNKLRIYQIAPC